MESEQIIFIQESKYHDYRNYFLCAFKSQNAIINFHIIFSNVNLILIKYDHLLYRPNRRSNFIGSHTSSNFAPQTIVSIRSTNLPWKRKHHVTLSKHREETKSRAISPCLHHHVYHETFHSLLLN